MDSHDELRTAFEADEHALRLRQSKVACVLGVVLIPAGVLLDAVSYPDSLSTFVMIRMAAASVIALIFALHFTQYGQNRVHSLTVAGLLVAVGSIAAMIALSNGASSDYYLGLFLIFFAVGVLLPVRRDEAIIFCGLTLSIYVIGCLYVPGAAIWSKDLLNNFYFLTLTAIITVTAAHFNYVRRFNEFTLKFKLASQHEKLSALDRLKSQFFANVSHELRTPLTLILAPVEKIKASNQHLSRDAKELLDIVENNALRLLRLVNDILSLIRLEEGTGNLCKRPFDVGQFVGHVVSSMKHLAEMKDVRLTASCAATDLWINADPDAMEKIVGNIVGNAIKFTPPGGKIELVACRMDRDAVVDIKDSGIGIPADKLPHIFDRFFQVDGSATRHHQGLGLGLALVRELSRKHNGDVVATSVAGQGTNFRLIFPHLSLEPNQSTDAKEEYTNERDCDPLHRFDRKANALIGQEETQPSPASTPLSALNNASKVLVVDDEPDMRRYLVSMLNKDLKVTEAADGTAALRIAQETLPDLVLLDVMLPGLSGLEVCKALKGNAQTRGIKIVVLTARADEEAKITALRHGADDFLIKPFSGLEVRTRLDNLLSASRLEKDLQTTNAQLEHSLKQLREAEAAMVQNARLSALGTMAAGLLHEIGNPLNFMGSALQLVAKDVAIKSRPDTAEIFDDIQAGFDRIRRVVTDLRGFTENHRPVTSDIFDMSSAIEHALRFTSHVSKGIDIEQQFDDHIFVHGTKSTISQVIVNLVVNAVAAVRAVEQQRKPTLLITARQCGDDVVVIVRDNGTGIDPAIQEKIFDPFFSTKEVGEGMGLGLAVSHRIVSNHGGSLNVKSCLGQWTEFSFSLPAAVSYSSKSANYAVG